MDNNNSFRQPPADTAPPSHPQAVGMNNLPVDQLRTWNFHHRSLVDGKVYEGQFTTKKLSVMELSRLDVRKTQLNGGFHYDEAKPGQGVEEHVDTMNSMIAHLEIALVQAPAWFNLDRLVDPMLLNLVYREVVQFENNFFRFDGSQAQTGRSSQDDSSGTGQESGSAGRVEAVGGNEVQPSVDP